jgi:signal transduction histidine kinase
LFWQALTTGRSRRYDELSERADVLNPQTEIRSEVVIPVGDHGVFIVAAEVTNAFDESDVQVLETLAGALDAALNSVESQQLLEEREQELKRQNKQLEEFADVVAHDIRGPLTAARGFLEIALETNSQEHFERVENAHERMERMINDLLTLASQGKSIADREPVDIGELARSVWPQIEGDATLEIEEQVPEVSGDASRLEQVLTNLFRNAVEHVGPTVTVRVGPINGTGFYVEDDGPGIPADKQPHIFDFGYTTDPRGTGLGLAIVKEIVEAHGWTISVTDGSGGGARFEIQTTT